MAAGVSIRHWTGAAGSPTKTDVTSATTVAVADNAHYGSGTINPVTIPSAGTNYSFWVPYRLFVDSTPNSSIGTIRFHTDGTNSSPTGVTWKGNTATSYIQPTGTVGTTGIILNTTNYSTLAGATVDIFTWTSGSPKTITGSLSAPSTGDLGDLLVVQMEVASTVVTTGETTGEVATFVWDET